MSPVLQDDFSLKAIPQQLTLHFPELHVLFRRQPLPLRHHRRPRRLLLCPLPHLLNPHVLLRPHPPLLERLPRRLQQRKPASPPSLRRPPRLRRLAQHLVPEEQPDARQRSGRAPEQQRHELLLRQRRHQQDLPDGQLRLLPAPRPPPAPGQHPDLRPVPLANHGRLRGRRVQQEPTAQPRLRRRRHHGQPDVRTRLRQREHPQRGLLFRRRRLQDVCCGVEDQGRRWRGRVVGIAGRSGGFDRGFVM